MIKATELLMTEDGEVTVQVLRFRDEEALTKYEWFDQLVGQYHVPDEPVVNFTDNSGEPFPEESVKEFQYRIKDKKGVMVNWSVEYDANYWFVEIDREDSVALLTSPHLLLRMIAQRLHTTAA